MVLVCKDLVEAALRITRTTQYRLGQNQEDIMKKIISGLLLIGLFVSSQSVTYAQDKETTTNNDALIAQIAKYREEGEQKVRDKKFTRKEVALTGDNVKETIKQKWEKMAAYYEGSKLVRIQLYPHLGCSGRSEEFYLMDNKLVFAFIQNKGLKQEGNDIGQPGKELYFHDDKIIKIEDRSDEPTTHADQEKKMYEATLPYEVSELLDILKQR